MHRFFKVVLAFAALIVFVNTSISHAYADNAAETSAESSICQLLTNNEIDEAAPGWHVTHHRGTETNCTWFLKSGINKISASIEIKIRNANETDRLINGIEDLPNGRLRLSKLKGAGELVVGTFPGEPVGVHTDCKSWMFSVLFKMRDPSMQMAKLLSVRALQRFNDQPGHACFNASVLWDQYPDLREQLHLMRP